MKPRAFKGPFALIILDGYGHNPNPRGNAVFAAKKPNIDNLLKTSSWTELVTFGERVGLPDDQMGNSEVGHLNIGAGRVVEQELTRINRAARDGSLDQNPTFQRALTQAKASGVALHILALTSTGGVHSSLEHIKSLALSAAQAGVKNIFVHAITDGRDRPPTASREEVLDLENYLEHEVSNKFLATARIVTICGRYYAMDRDKRWERTERAYDLYTQGVGTPCDSVDDALRTQHESGKTDEFLEPCVISGGLSRSPLIENGDLLLFANFRADRMRQIVRTFLPESAQTKFTGFNRKSLKKVAGIFTLTEYEEDLPVEVLYRPFVVDRHFGWLVAHEKMTQLRLAETEKYAHVTYFFSGGNEEVLAGEQRILIPSPKEVATYDLKPEMSAAGVADALIDSIRSRSADVSIVNFANCDMVGHTGVFDAAVKAVETVDGCLGRILAELEAADGAAIITADHGNADQMIDYETGGPHTFHTKYPVPFAVWGKAFKNVKLAAGGALCDIAPTACEMLSISKPDAMSGRSLLY